MEEVRRVSTIFTIDDSDHNRKLKQINDQYKLTQSEIKLAGQRMDALGKSTGDLNFKKAALTKQIETLNSKTKLYQDSMAKTTVRAEENQKKLDLMRMKKDNLTKSIEMGIEAHGKDSVQVKRLNEEMDKLNKDIVEQERVVKKNVDSINNYQTQVNKVEGELVSVQAELEKVNQELADSQNKWKKSGEAMQQAGEKLQNVGSKMQTAGRSLSTYVTLPLVAMGTAAVNEAIKFESAFAGVQKTVDGTAEQIENLRTGIIKMSKEIPSTTEEISKVAEAAGQLGIETDSIMDFTKVIIDLGNATNIVGDEGASQLAKFANITQMSQKDFDRLGSTIVDLGNNLATTEADIVSMAMRLAGAGAQVGISEAQILALSGALSSVGIEAEAGGSAFSKVMINMQLAAETGGESLKDFAKVAGMSSKDFAKAYKEDATGALLAFIEGLATSEERGISAIKVLDDMGITEVRMRDSLLRAANASGVFSDAINIGTKAWEENVALTNEANQRYATTESQIKITKNEIADLGRELGEDLLPIVKDGLVVIKDLVKAFTDLPEETQKNIVKFGLLAAALGPVLSVGGKLVSGAGTLLKLSGGLVAKIGGAGGLTALTSGLGGAAGTAAGAGGVAGLTSSMGGVIAAAGPYALALAGIATAGYLVYENLTEDVIPAVDLFADEVTYATDTIGGQTASLAGTVETSVVKISDATKEAIQAYVDMDNQVTSELNDLFGSSTKITDELVTDMTTKFGNMSQTIIDGYQRQKEESMKQLTDFFMQSNTLTTTEEAKILSETNAHYEQKKNVAQEAENRINEILERAYTEKRSLTATEVQEINRMQFAMKDAAVQALSETEVEAKAIQARLVADRNRINAKGAAEYISKLNQVRDEAVTAANTEYEQRVATIIRMRDELGVISEEQAADLIRSAEVQKEGTIKAAEDTRIGAIDKFREMYGDLDKNVDTSTGEILSKFDKMKRWWNGWTPETKNFSATITMNQRTATQGSNKAVNAYALGTTNAIGGISMVNEKGYELIDLPAGSKVRTHESSKQMVKDIVDQTMRGLSKQMRGVTVSGNNFIINNEMDIEEVAQELAFRTEKKLGGVGIAYNPV